MERAKLVDLLSRLNNDDFAGINYSEELLLCEVEDTCKQLKCSFEEIFNSLPHITELYFSKETPANWKYVCVSLYLLKLINNDVESQNDVLSVQQRNALKKCIENVIIVGISTKLQPNLPFYMATDKAEPKDIFLNYNILKCTTYGLCEFLKFPNLRLLILPDKLKPILVAIYQICFCPLKKPGKTTDELLTDEIFNKLMNERTLFRNLLQHLRETIHQEIYVKQTMAIFFANSPTWFKRSVSQTLTSIIRSRNGVECLAVALFDGVNNDTTQTWKILDVFSKLILSCKQFPDFQDNICKQLSGMLDKIADQCLIFERIYIHCTKSIYWADAEVGKNIFVRKIIEFFLYFTYKNHKFETGESIIGKIKQHSRLLHAVFAEKSAESPKLPPNLLTSSIGVIFRFYTLTLDNEFRRELRDVLLEFLCDNDSLDSYALFDCFLFGINSKEILPFRNDIILKTTKDDILIEYSDHVVTYSTAENSDFLLELLKTKTDLLVKLFGYLLNCLITKDRYFQKSDQALINIEAEFMNECLERKLIVYKLLSTLADNKHIQAHVTRNPKDILTYMNNVFEKSISTSLHKSADFDKEEYQTFFTTLMILQILISDTLTLNPKEFGVLNKHLQIIKDESPNEEVRDLVEKILKVLRTNETGRPRRMVVEEFKSEMDKAIEDICDPLLPIRGHGLMTLTKLIEKKDKKALERKQYVLNIFQQTLKNEDSYIYLSAIGGLAAMADIFPDTVLNIICEEYSDSSKKHNDEGHEVRVKLGETLVRVTKHLGDMAPKYKPLLLNTFLLGAKDEDSFIRASSLSNLGEICRVLGYKLGTIVTEVLVCVHAIITTDKAPEARRAAVTVLRQLLAGLESEMIAFLKDDILPIYRTLKEIYHNDKDDVMRLQAQLALEELNENMRNFVFPKPQLSQEKKIVMLN